MRTNIDIDDDLMREAIALAGPTTKKNVVEEGLRTFIQLRRQAEARKLRGTVNWVGDLDEMRRD